MNRDDLTRTLFKGGVVLFLGLVIDLGVSFVAKVLIARYLGRVDYGAVSLGSAFLSFASTFVLLGLNTGIGRYLPRFDADTEHAERRAVMLIGIALMLPLTLAVSSAVLLNPDWVATTIFGAPDAGGVLAVFAVALPFAATFKLVLGIVQGYQWSVPKAILQNILKPTVRFGGIALGIWLGLDAVGMSVAYVVPFGVTVVASLYWLRRTALFDLSTSFRDVDVEYQVMARDLLSFSVPLIVTTVMMSILTDIDRFLLSYYQSTGDVGIYGVIYPLARLLTVGLNAFSFIFMPILSELHAEGRLNEMRRMYQVATKWIFFLTVPIGAVLILFPRHVVRYTFGAEYVPGSMALAVLAIGFLPHAVVGLNGAALTSVGRTKTLAVVNVVAATVNIGLNIVLIPQYSYLGAAAATAVSYAGMNAVYTWILYRTTGIQPFSQALIRPGIVLIGYSTLLYLSLTQIFGLTWIWFGIHLLAAGIGYTVIILRFGGVQEEEVLIITSVEERFGVDLELLKARARELMK